jgi:hypothetical protein
MYTTLNKIREKEPCFPGWDKLLEGLNKTEADDEHLSIISIIDSNGIVDAIWCLRAVEGHDKEIRLFAVWCARQVQYLMTDPRSIAALDIAERFANGEASSEELSAAKADASAASMAAWDAEAADLAAWAAEAAAWADASAAAWVDAMVASAAAMSARAAQEKRLREICESTIQAQE